MLNFEEIEVLLVFGRFFYHIDADWAHIRHMYMHYVHAYVIVYVYACVSFLGPSRNEQKTKKTSRGSPSAYPKIRWGDKSSYHPDQFLSTA